jgi:hypothetical protein
MVIPVLTMVAAASVIALRTWILRPMQPQTLRGAVVVSSDDVDKRVPIGNVRVSVAGGLASQDSWSDSEGFFALSLNKRVKAGQPIILEFRHLEYRPLDLTLFASDRIVEARLMPVIPPPAANRLPHIVVSNVTIRYSVKTTTLVNVGSVAKTFRVVNAGNVPCDRRLPCSPDKKWKAALGSETLEAPGGNVFSNARVSCISGPCPFTRIRTDEYSRGGPTIHVTVLNWSNTTTFLFEAEVYHSMINNSSRTSYPVIFGQTLHFTVPAEAEGVCINADIGRDSIVFPLGPEPRLSWAQCTETVGPHHTEVYECELNPGYDFK